MGSTSQRKEFLMNLYDKRTSQNIIKSRVIKTRSFENCTDCKIEPKPCPRGCPRITTEMHIDDGYIVYLSSKEIEFISKSYKDCLANLGNNIGDITKVFATTDDDEPPLELLDS